MRRLWVVAPVYLDVVSFRILRERILASVAGVEPWRDATVQFVVVDDTAGLDPEIDILREYSDVAVVAPPFNLGHQRAIVYALRITAPHMNDSDYVITMDSDGEDDPADIVRLLDGLSSENVRALAVATRTSRHETVGFKLFYVLFRMMFVLLTGTTVRSGNFAAYRGWLARRVLKHPSFDVSYAAALLSLDLPRIGVPCARAKRYAGQSRMGLGKLVRHGVSMLMPYLDRIAIRALIFFTTVVTACVVLALAVLAVRLSTNQAIPNWVAALLVVLAIASFVAIGNFVILFAVYTQSRGLALSRLEEESGETLDAFGAGRPSALGISEALCNGEQ